MKAKHGITKSERKTYRTMLHSSHNGMATVSIYLKKNKWRKINIKTF